MLAKDTLEEFKLECELRRLTPRTIKGYYNSTLLFLTWLERQQEIKELEAIRPQHIYKSNGYDIVLVQRLLQHSSAATTQRYIGIEPQRIEQAIENHSVLM